MKVLFFVLLAFLAGCSQAPDFTTPVTVIKKFSWATGSKYILKHDQGTRGSGWGSVEFYAPTDFARIGDTIIFEDGVLKVK